MLRPGWLAPLLALVFAVSAAAEPATATSPAEANPVQLPPYKVNGGDFDVWGQLGKGTTKLGPMKVTWVSPRLKKLGLRIGDLLLSVNDQPVPGMEEATFRRFMEVNLGPGEKRVYVFNSKRSFLRKSRVTVVFTGHPPKNADSGAAQASPSATETIEPPAPGG